MKKKGTTDILIDNLIYLKELRGDSVYKISERSKIPARTVSNILAREQTKVSVEQADQLASAYGLEGWHLLLPNLPKDLVESPTITRLVNNYINANSGGREVINMIAEREGANKSSISGGENVG